MATLSVGNLLVSSFETGPSVGADDTTVPYSPHCCTDGNSGCDTNVQAGCTDPQAGCQATGAAA
jgi:hypothetical protein